MAYLPKGTGIPLGTGTRQDAEGEKQRGGGQEEVRCIVDVTCA